MTLIPNRIKSSEHTKENTQTEVKWPFCHTLSLIVSSFESTTYSFPYDRILLGAFQVTPLFPVAFLFNAEVNQQIWSQPSWQQRTTWLIKTHQENLMPGQEPSGHQHSTASFTPQALRWTGGRSVEQHGCVEGLTPSPSASRGFTSD